MPFGLIIGYLGPYKTATASRFTTIANSQTLQFTRAHTSLFSLLCWPAVAKTAANDVVFSAPVFTLLVSGDCLANNTALLRNYLHDSIRGNCLQVQSIVR